MKYIPKTEKGKAKLSSILECAIELIAQKGFNNTSISEITQKAGVSHGSFYFYFKNKDDLLVELVEYINKSMRHYLTENTKHLKDRLSIEKRGFEAFFEWMAKNKKLYKILIEAESNNIKLYEWHYNKISDRYAKKLNEAMERGEIKRYDPKILSFALMGIADFIAKKYILWSNTKISQEVVEEVKNILENILAINA